MSQKTSIDGITITGKIHSICLSSVVCCINPHSSEEMLTRYKIQHRTLSLLPSHLPPSFPSPLMFFVCLWFEIGSHSVA